VGEGSRFDAEIMPELTQRMIDAGAVMFDSNGIPMRADGTPALEENSPQEEIPQGNPVLAQIAAMEGLVAGEERGGGPFQGDPLGYSFAPFYSPSSQDYPENRTPVTPENFGLPSDWDFRSGEGSWEQLHTPNDRSAGGGFFTAEDQFSGQVPTSFQQGASSPSTNNYRLLPPEYRTPQFIMRNGYIIDRYATDLHGPEMNRTESHSQQGSGPFWKLGSAVTTGYPAGYAYGFGGTTSGWPGSHSWTQPNTFL
jgi:hypothetical protein